MSGTRMPVAAGTFYPAAPERLAAVVDGLLEAAARTPLAGELRALVVPHAGYAYSGATAAAAYAAMPADVRRVALVGPSHYVPAAVPTASGAEAWRTPLGDVAVDLELRDRAAAAGAAVADAPHADEHALEVQLPFLQRRLGDGLAVLPVAAAHSGTDEVLAALAPHALVVVSTDLSHFLDDAEARRQDRCTAEAVVALDDTAIGPADACGAEGLRALLAQARASRWRCTLLDLRTSADATGDRRRVVGYGAFAFVDQSKQRSATSADV